MMTYPVICRRITIIFVEKLPTLYRNVRWPSMRYLACFCILSIPDISEFQAEKKIEQHLQVALSYQRGKNVIIDLRQLLIKLRKCVAIEAPVAFCARPGPRQMPNVHPGQVALLMPLLPHVLPRRSANGNAD
jgi:hypothetical protein